MHMHLDDERKSKLQLKLAEMFNEEFDEDLSEFRAGQLLDIVLKAAGPTIYNQAVQDVRAYFQSRLDDLDGEVYLDE